MELQQITCVKDDCNYSQNKEEDHAGIDTATDVTKTKNSSG